MPYISDESKSVALRGSLIAGAVLFFQRLDLQGSLTKTYYIIMPQKTKVWSTDATYMLFDISFNFAFRSRLEVGG